MGVLDDAIREHLELKRLHGAAEEELRRQEAEALGPARRQVAPEQAQQDSEPGDAEVAAAVEQPEAEPVAGDGAAEELEAPHAEQASFDEPSDEHELAVGQPEAFDEDEDEPPFSSADAALPDTEESSAVAAEDTPPRGLDPLDDDPLEDEQFDDEPLEPAAPGADGSDASDASDDVLEDTPDFLQETPEHDRLWFEQKPPRDFDFD